MGASATYRLIIALTVAILAVDARALNSGSLGKGKLVKAEVLEEMARAKLDKKLLDVSQSNELRVKQHPETNPSPGLLDPDSGNPTKSRMAFHDRVVPTCLEVTTAKQCDKWLSPYVSLHGTEGGQDSSDLEDMMGKFGQQASSKDPKDTLAIFDIEKNGGRPVVDTRGRMNLTGVTKFQLKKEIRTAVDGLGYQNAQVELARVPNEGAKGGDASEVAMPNEVYRAMARDWTQMLRNRLVAKLGQQRAATKDGGEAITDFDMPECEQYFNAVAQNDDPVLGREKRLPEQAPLFVINRTLDQRYQMCQAMRAATIFDVNPKSQGGQLQNGDANSEPIDQALTRINIAMMDNAGLDPNQAPKPSNLTFKREDYAQLVADCTPNSKGCNGVTMTNAEQINSFNNARKEAWQSIQNAAKRSANINPEGYKKLTEEIATGPGAQTLMQINGLTPEMRGELKGKEFVQKSAIAQNNGPDNTLERTPSALVVKGTQ